MILKSEQEDQAEESYQDTSILIAILSPTFLQSQVLLNGLVNFQKIANQEGGLFQSGIPWIFKVNKSPLDTDELLPDLQNIISHDFFQTDPHTGEVHEFNRFFGPEAERDYWMKLMDIAYDIYQFQIQKDPGTGKLAKPSLAETQTVYLASTGVDLVFHRDVIKRELLRHGYRVLPDQSLPKEEKALEQRVSSDLKNCNLSIHLIGEDYGQLASGSECSLIDIQNQLATNHSVEVLKTDPKSGFHRFIWITPDLENVTERQKIFIEDLKSDAESLESSEIFQVPLNDFRGFLRHELFAKEVKKAPELAQEVSLESEDPGSSSIYLICDQRDMEGIRPLADLLKNEGFEVVSSSFEGDLLNLRERHHKNLSKCDGSIIFLGHAKEEWLKTKIHDILKAPGFGRHKPMKAKAVYLGTAKDLEDKLQDDTLILGKSGKLDPEALKPFLTKLEN